MYTKNTKIICTLGPASDSTKEIIALSKAGMNVARLNFSHGTHENHAKLIRNIHKAEKASGKRIGILQDLQGPKIRIGEMPENGILLKKNDLFEFTPRKIIGKKEKGAIIIPISHKHLLRDIKKDDIVLINDGLIETRVVKVGKTSLTCRVLFGDIVKTRQGVNFPTASASVETITSKDKKDLKFGLKHKVDFVALSFVKSKKDIDDLRDLIEKEKKSTKIIAKIERHEAVKNLRAIIKAADGVMVARGDLGSDLPPEQVPIVQKRIINLANKYGKPVITATQVLQSMVTNSKPTRAEISDAANAVFDHTDAIMLSNESAVGKYPVKAASILTRVTATVEKELQTHDELVESIVKPRTLSSINATCLNACELAMDTNADQIIVYTEDGYTARQIVKHRLYTPVITITPTEKIARELTLVWGINKILINKFKKHEINKIDAVINFAKKKRVVKKGEKVVIVCNASRKEAQISTTRI